MVKCHETPDEDKAQRGQNELDFTFSFENGERALAESSLPYAQSGALPRSLAHLFAHSSKATATATDCDRLRNLRISRDRGGGKTKRRILFFEDRSPSILNYIRDFCFSFQSFATKLFHLHHNIRRKNYFHLFSLAGVSSSRVLTRSTTEK